MDWIERNQVLLAFAVLGALIIVGLVILTVRALGLYRTARSGMQLVDEPVRAISNGLADAEQRVGRITDGQADLEAALQRVGSHTGELKLLMDHAGRALAVLRAPFRYLGR